MPTSEDRNVAKEIMIAYIAHSNAAGALFNPESVQSLHFESVWERILKSISESVR